MTKGRGTGAKPAAPRRPLWRRLNRHGLFVLHFCLFLFVGTWVWTLNAPALDKQFDTLLLLTILCGHGVVAYRNHRIAFLPHLVMFSAGNGAIWATTARLNDKLTVMLAWIAVVVISGVWLARRLLKPKPQPPPAQRKPRGRKAPAPPPPQDWYDAPEEAETPVEAEDGWYDEPQAHSEGDYYDDYAEPTPSKKRGRR